MEFVAAVCCSVACVALTREPERFTEIKRRYALLRDHLRTLDEPRWKPIHKQCVLVAILWNNGGHIGWNTNKGYEIGVCIDGTPNQIFHVLLHELAHCTLEEYEHNAEFWNNFKDLKNIAVSLGLYEIINKEEKYCSKKVVD